MNNAASVSAEDLVDLLWDALKKNPPGRNGKWGRLAAAPFNRPYTSLRAKRSPEATVRRGGRIFLSEYEIKKLLQTGEILKIPASAILSPLAQDWLALKGVKIVRED